MAASVMLAAISLSGVAAGKVPQKPGACVNSHIDQVGQRLEDGKTQKPIADSGSWVSFANGLSQVSYDEEPAINESRHGDPVSICLVKLPRHCPPGDDRGKIYKTTNLRSLKSWTLPDSEHMCGGA